MTTQAAKKSTLRTLDVLMIRHQSGGMGRDPLPLNEVNMKLCRAGPTVESRSTLFADFHCFYDAST